MARVAIRKLPRYGGKYWLSFDGRVWRMDADGQLHEVAQTGTPPRVRLYQHGKEYRAYVHVLFERWWPTRVPKKYPETQYVSDEKFEAEGYPRGGGSPLDDVETGQEEE